MRVRKGSVYIYDPVLLDVIDGRTDLKAGDEVRVIHCHGCPPPNTMNHCHVERLNGQFVGLVHCNSLTKKEKQNKVKVAS